MENDIFVMAIILLGIVVVALSYTIATLQSENSDLRNQVSQIDENMYANDSAYKVLDDVNK